MDERTGHIYTAQQLQKMQEDTERLLGEENYQPAITPDELRAISPHEYSTMAGMNRKQRREYMARQKKRAKATA